MLRRLLAASFALAACAQAAIIHVPGDQPTIQRGINAAAEGDTVLVAPGTYSGPGNKNIDFHGINRVLKSEAGTDATRIDCEGTPENKARGFYFHSEETTDSVVDGFTILKGYAPGAHNEEQGGAILCVESSPTLANCRIINNEAVLTGGGIACRSHSSPRLTNCIIEYNSAAHGAGLDCVDYSSPQLENCTIVRNSSNETVMGGSGGGIKCARYSSPVLTNCTIANNTLPWNSWVGNGAGLCCYESSAILTNCMITDNSSGGRCGGLYCKYSSPTLINCTITGNSTKRAGGGLYCYNASPTLINCTIADNSAELDGGGLYCISSSLPELVNCILWGDSPNEIRNVGVEGPVLTYCDIEGGWNSRGVGNLAAAPLFVDATSGDYHLTEGSPCIDAGTTSSVGAPMTDFEGDPRPLGAGHDIGADEFNPVGVSGSPSPVQPRKTMLSDAYPSPFNPYTTIPFELTEASQVKLAIYDITGALVRVLEDDTRQAGSHAVTWDGTNEAGQEVATGVYVVRLEAAGLSEVRKVLLVK